MTTTRNKALGIAAVALAGAGLVALAVCFNHKAGDETESFSAKMGRMCGNAAARENAGSALLDSLCLAAGYGPVTGRTP